MIASSIFFQCANARWSNGYGGTVAGWQCPLCVAVTRVHGTVLTTERLKNMRISCAQHVFNAGLLCIQGDKRSASAQSKDVMTTSQNNRNLMFPKINKSYRCIH